MSEKSESMSQRILESLTIGVMELTPAPVLPHFFKIGHHFKCSTDESNIDQIVNR